MTSAITIQSRAFRVEVFSLLGAQCAHCGCLHGLAVDVILPMTVRHHDLGNYRRWKLYLKLARESKVQLLCVTCHRVKSRREARSYRKVPSGRAGPAVILFSAGDGI